MTAVPAKSGGGILVVHWTLYLITRRSPRPDAHHCIIKTSATENRMRSEDAEFGAR